MRNNTKLKILMLLDNDYPKDERVEKEAETLHKLGHDVYILATNFNDRQKYANINGVNIIRLNLSKTIKNKLHPFAATLPFYTWYWKRKVVQLFNTYSFDVIHCHDLPLCSVGYEIKKQFPSIKYFADLHENFPNLIQGMSYMKNAFVKRAVNVKLWYNKERKWLKNADGIIVTAPGMKQRLQSAGIVQNNWGIVENTIRLKDFNIEEAKPDKNYITLFYSGGITIHRGLQIALEGYSIAKEKYKNLRFWIVGAGKYEGELRKMITSKNIKDVTFWGWKSQPDMFRIMQNSDIGIIPHLRSEHTNNTSPNKIFHYFRAKIPVLVSNCDYLKEVILKSQAGLYYNDQSPNDFANQLIELILSKDKKGFGHNGYEAVSQKYNWTITQKELKSVYNKITLK